MTIKDSDHLQAQLERFDLIQTLADDDEFPERVFDARTRMDYEATFEATISEDPRIDAVAQVNPAGDFNLLDIYLLKDGCPTSQMHVEPGTGLWQAMEVWLADLREDWMPDEDELFESSSTNSCDWDDHHPVGKSPTEKSTGRDSDTDDPRHVFLSAREVMQRYGWGQTRGYQKLKNQNLVPLPVTTRPNRWRLDHLMAWEDRIFVEAQKAMETPEHETDVEARARRLAAALPQPKIRRPRKKRAD
ncbi:hypothetical protein [Brevibacterium sp. 1718]|uniref:hypothetical protein n=1 Tax=Brevibacterium sp. 1718 TaxID=3413510 RepID=UPI003DA8B14A